MSNAWMFSEPCKKDPDTIEALQQEVRVAMGSNSIFDRFVGSLSWAKPVETGTEFDARWLVEKMALALQAAALIRTGHQSILTVERESVEK